MYVNFLEFIVYELYIVFVIKATCITGMFFWFKDLNFEKISFLPPFSLAIQADNFYLDLFLIL